MNSFDIAEQRFLADRERNKELNERRAAAGLPPVTAAVAPESYVETMAYTAHDVPWHVNDTTDTPGAKVAIAAPLTASEMIVAAGLDWTVAKGNLWGGPKQRLVEDKKAIYRESDGKVLGTCSERYQTINNQEVFSFMDSLVDDGLVHFETSGSLYGGRAIWILAKMEEDWTIRTQAGNDLHNSYICAITRHDGSGRLQAFLTEVRVVCRNSSRLALANAEFSASVTHKGDVSANLARARQLLKVTTGAQRRYQEWMQQLAETEIGQDEVDAVQDAMFGSMDEDTSVRRQNQIAKFLDIYHSEAEREGNTGYALANGITGFAAHIPSLRAQADGSEGMLSLLYGPNHNYTNSGFSALEKVTGLALSEA